MSRVEKSLTKFSCGGDMVVMWSGFNSLTAGTISSTSSTLNKNEGGGERQTRGGEDGGGVWGVVERDGREEEMCLWALRSRRGL